jgi:demethylmenaquinone methyltransferase / 2-methoxy-6-polyprenyl-1,4-benzoquinol methylase
VIKPVSTIIPPPAEKPRYVNQMFARIAPTYDRMNRLMTLGQDQRWRRALLDLADLPPHGTLLDVGAGTGDIAYAAQALLPGAQAVAADFTYEMMAVGQRRSTPRPLPFTQADTFALPFANDTFDAVVSGFLIRNVVDRAAALREQARVVKPGGRLLCLETTPPANALLSPLFRLYFFRVVPWLGGWISGDRQAYAYLPHSTIDFPTPAELQRMMELAGLHHVFYQEFMFGTVAIHVGTKVGT